MKRNFTTYFSSIVLLPVILVASFGINKGLAQSVGIASTTITPDAQSILDIQSTSKGVLLPRMTTAQRIAISPTNSSDLGLSVYDTDTDSYWYWDGTVWQEIPNTSSIVTTLDGAYDGGGSGVGRIITADAGAVDIQGTGGLLVSGQTAINTTPQSNFKLSVLANSGTQGVYILSSGGAGGTYGLHSTTATANYTPIFGENSSTSTGSAYSAVRGALSTPIAANGYLGYHTTGNNSYAVYGTGGTYAGYFAGNTNVDGGNLGVGMNTAATERLQVAGNIYLSSANPVVRAGNAFDITGSSGVDIVIDSDNNSTNAAFRVQKDAGATIFELQEDNDIFFTDLAGGGTQLLQADNFGQVTLSSVNSANLISGSGTPTQIAYFDGTQSITSESSLFWDPTNNRLGIGTSIPNTSLEIQVPENGTSLNVPLVVRNAGTNTNTDAVGIGFVNETAANNYGNFYKSAIVHERTANFGLGSLHFIVDDGADGNSATMNETRMSITYQGNVGIGDVTPDAKLDVDAASGNLLILANSGTQRALVDINGNLTIAGKFVSSGIEETSDRRFKKDISPLSNALQNVMKLQGVSYAWRRDEFKDRSFGSQTEIGVIAQEVEKVYPEVVGTDKDGYKSVQYSHLVPVLIEAIKTQQEMIQMLEAKLEQMSASTKDVMQRLDALTVQLNANDIKVAPTIGLVSTK